MVVHHTVTMTFSVFDAGCLPRLLVGESERVDAYLARVDVSKVPEEMFEAMKQYAAQLRRCLAVVEEARKRETLSVPLCELLWENERAG